MNPPAPPQGGNPEASWHRRLLAWNKTERVLQIVGFTMKQTNDGKIFVPTGLQQMGKGIDGWRWSEGVNYDATISYKIGEVVIVEPWSSAATTGYTDADSGSTVYSMPGIYVCTRSIGTPSGTYHTPQWPPPQTSPTAGAPWNYTDAKVYWILIAQYPTQHYVIKTLSSANYYLANTYDGTNIGTQDFYIAKPKRLRDIASEVIDGTSISYSFVDDNNRTANDGTNTEDQVAYPRFKEHGTTSGAHSPNTLSIVAAHCPVNGTNVSVGGVPVFLEEFLPSRVWAKKFV